MDAFAKANPGRRSRSTPSTTTRSRRTSTTTCRARPTTCSPGSPATACSSSPSTASPATSATCGRSTGMSDALQEGVDRRDGKQYFVPITLLPVGGLLPEVVFEKNGYEVPHDLRRAQRPRRQMQEGRAHPDRLRRQGRLAGDGHLRQPQHADQRLRLPHQPDGRQGVVGQRRGQEGLRHLAGHPAPTTRPTPSAAPGRRPRSSLAKGETGMYLLGTFVVAAVPEGRRQDDLDFFTFPEIDSTIGTDAVEAPIDGFMMAAAQERGGRQGCSSTSRHPEAADAAIKPPTRRSSPPTTRPTPAATPPCRRSRRAGQAAKSIAQFLDRDTRRTSPRP